MRYPEALTVDGQDYDINTGYEDALACIACINDPELGDTERAFGVLALLYKEEPENANEALRMAIKYLQRGKGPEEIRPSAQSAPDMDYEHDMHYIRSSFRSDYGIDLGQRDDMHWWEFSELLQGLTDKCILNRIRDLRNYDLSTITDPKTMSKVIQAQREVALPKQVSQEDQDALDAFFAQLEQPAE